MEAHLIQSFFYNGISVRPLLIPFLSVFFLLFFSEVYWLYLLTIFLLLVHSYDWLVSDGGTYLVFLLKYNFCPPFAFFIWVPSMFDKDYLDRSAFKFDVYREVRMDGREDDNGTSSTPDLCPSFPPTWLNVQMNIRPMLHFLTQIGLRKLWLKIGIIGFPICTSCEGVIGSPFQVRTILLILP